MRCVILIAPLTKVLSSAVAFMRRNRKRLIDRGNVYFDLSILK